MNELRLELVKLTYTHARGIEEAIERARELEKFIMEDAPKVEAKAPFRRPPVAGGNH